MNKSLEIEWNESNNTNKPSMKIYDSLMDSLLFNGYEKLLLIYFLTHSTMEINTINTTTVSVKKLNESTKISKPTIYKRIKDLEEKGVLIKEKNISIDNGNTANTYKILNYTTVWNCKTLEELKKETDKIKREVLTND